MPFERANFPWCALVLFACGGLEPPSEASDTASGGLKSTSVRAPSGGTAGANACGSACTRVTSGGGVNAGGVPASGGVSAGALGGSSAGTAGKALAAGGKAAATSSGGQAGASAGKASSGAGGSVVTAAGGAQGGVAATASGGAGGVAATASGGAGGVEAGAAGQGGAAVAGAAGAPSELAPPFFSEYVEGTSNYKALEIAAGEARSLLGCQIEIYANGADKRSRTIALGGVATREGPLVVCTPQLVSLVAACSLSEALSFTGNDVVLLVCDGRVVDAFGRLLEDPGENGWGTQPTRTADVTLRRACDVTRGDSDPNDAFDPAREWLPAALDSFNNLGVHCAAPQLE
ncbi:MAG: hypothetical protein QM756_12525 [Polyangiaceae bacterium]